MNVNQMIELLEQVKKDDPKAGEYEVLTFDPDEEVWEPVRSFTHGRAFQAGRFPNGSVKLYTDCDG